MHISLHMREHFLSSHRSQVLNSLAFARLLPSPHSPLLHPCHSTIFSSSTHHALFIRTPRYNRTQSKRFFSPPKLRPFVFFSISNTLSFHFVSSYRLETLQQSQHRQLEEISILESLDALHPISPDWVSFVSKTGRECYRNCQTLETHKRSLRKDSLSFPFFLSFSRSGFQADGLRKAEDKKIKCKSPNIPLQYLSVAY
jgi:hypothetical protein